MYTCTVYVYDSVHVTVRCACMCCNVVLVVLCVCVHFISLFDALSTDVVLYDAMCNACCVIPESSK